MVGNLNDDYRMKQCGNVTVWTNDKPKEPLKTEITELREILKCRERRTVISRECRRCRYVNNYPQNYCSRCGYCFMSFWRKVWTLIFGHKLPTIKPVT